MACAVQPVRCRQRVVTLRRVTVRSRHPQAASGCGLAARSAISNSVSAGGWARRAACQATRLSSLVQGSLSPTSDLRSAASARSCSALVTHPSSLTAEAIHATPQPSRKPTRRLTASLDQSGPTTASPCVLDYDALITWSPSAANAGWAVIQHTVPEHHYPSRVGVVSTAAAATRPPTIPTDAAKYPDKGPSFRRRGGGGGSPRSRAPDRRNPETSAAFARSHSSTSMTSGGRIRRKER